MTNFIVERMIWEYGSKYGHIYYPTSLYDLREKITELDKWGREQDYPFFIEMHLTDQSYLGFNVAHTYSLMEFGYKEDLQDRGPFYVCNHNGNEDEIIPIYYFASYTEPDTTRMLPLQQVLAAVYHYVEHRKFPSFIRLNNEKANTQFVIDADEG